MFGHKKFNLLKITLTLILAVATLLCIPAMMVYATPETSETELVPDGEALPRIDITTDSGAAVTKKEYEGASMLMTLTDRFADCQNTYTGGEGGRVTIKCRGNTSYDLNKTAARTGKYSYKIRLDEKVDMLGMGESRHWALIANIFDMTSMRNKLTYDLSGMLGMPYSQSRWVVVYMNGEYRGLYSLVESIRVEEGRVDITDWNDIAKKAAKAIARGNGMSDADADALVERMQNDLSWLSTGTFEGYTVSEYYDISGLRLDSGYIIEYDKRLDGDGVKFRTSHDKPIEIVKPTAVGTNDEMVNFVKGLFDSFEEAIYSPNYCTEDGRHYSEFVDYDSLVDYFLLNELFKNTEFGYLSIFMYIEGGKICFGPCWDIDCSSGNQVTLYKAHMGYDGWMITSDHGEWWKKLCADPLYQTRVASRWFEIRPLVDDMLASTEIYYKYIYEESQPNFKQNRPYNWYITKEIVKSFDKEYEALCTWLDGRVKWLDTTMASREPNIEGSGPVTSAKMDMTLSGEVVELDSALLGAYADYIISSSGAGSLTLTIETAHSTQKSIELYINGRKIGEHDIAKDTPAVITLDIADLDLSQGAVNVIRAMGKKANGDYYRNTYITLAAVGGDITADNKSLVRIDGAGLAYLENGAKITLPEIAEPTYEGYTVLGWTDGENTFAAGSEVTADGDVRYSILLERTDLYPDTPREIETPPTPPTAPPATEPPITTEPPTTTETAPITTTPPITTPPTTTEIFEPYPIDQTDELDGDTRLAVAIIVCGVVLLAIVGAAAFISRRDY